MSSQLLAAKVSIQEEEPKVRAIAAAATSVTGFVGVTKRGPVGVATRVSSPAEYTKIFGGYTGDGDVAQSVDMFFGLAGTGKALWIVRTVHYTDPAIAATKTSAKATGIIPTAALAQTAGWADASLAEPFNLTPGDTLVIERDASGAATATFTATAASREAANAEPYALANGQTITFGGIDGAPATTKTFATAEFAAIGAATAEEVVAALNAHFLANNINAIATVTSGGTKPTITSKRLGTSSGVNISGGTANGTLGFVTGNQAGTGNVANIDAVTAAEVKTVVEGAVSGTTVTSVSGRPRITSNTLGAASRVQVMGSSTADDELGFDNANHQGNNAGTLNALTVEGKSDGTYANTLVPRIENATSGAANEFNFLVLEAGVVLETWPNVSIDPTHPRYIETILNDANNGSNLVQATDMSPATSSPLNRPANGSYAMTGGNDGLASIGDNDFVGSQAGRTGLRALDAVADLGLLAVPGRSTSVMHNAMLTYTDVTRNGRVFAVLDSPAGMNKSAIVTYVKSTALLQGSTEHGAIYWPRVKVANPSKSLFGNSTTILAPPSAAVCGRMAKNDERDGGVYEAPAGIEWGKLSPVVLGVEDIEVNEEDARDLVFPELINPITAIDGKAVHIDGARTLKADGNFPTIGERRGVSFIETSVQSGLEFAKHRKIKPRLLAELQRNVKTFLRAQTALGAFASDAPDEAFFVDFGPALNPPSEGFVRRVNGRIGLATAKPAEYIVIRVSQDTRALEAELAAAA